jgi:hypothetical protein
MEMILANGNYSREAELEGRLRPEDRWFIWTIFIPSEWKCRLPQEAPAGQGSCGSKTSSNLKEKS